MTPRKRYPESPAARDKRLERRARERQTPAWKEKNRNAAAAYRVRHGIGHHGRRNT